MEWLEKDKIPAATTHHVNDVLQLTPDCWINIEYKPWPGTTMFISFPYDKRDAVIDPADREGTRRMVLRELLPMAEATLVELRKAVAELPAEPYTDVLMESEDQAAEEQPHPIVCEMCGRITSDVRLEGDWLCPSCRGEGS